MSQSISNMQQVWMSNTNTYNGIAMSISTMGYGANSRSRIFSLSVDGDKKFAIDANGRVTALDISANTITVNTIVALSTANSFSSNTISTNSLTVANRNITKGSMPTGSSLQVVQAVKTDAWNTSSTTPVDITGLSVSITPTSSTSKILIIVDLKWSSYAHCDIYLLRNGTKIYYGDLYGNQTQALLHSYASGGADDYGLAYGHATYLDSPATTSSVTYKLQAAVPWSSSYQVAVNYMRPNENNAYNARVASSITVVEIAQ